MNGTQPYIFAGRQYRRGHVIVLPRSEQKKCKHKWRRRPWSMITSGWRNICKDCGALSR